MPHVTYVRVLSVIYFRLKLLASGNSSLFLQSLALNKIIIKNYICINKLFILRINFFNFLSVIFLFI